MIRGASRIKEGAPMERRKFTQGLLAAAGAGLFPRFLSGSGPGMWAANVRSGTTYIREAAPRFEIPPYRGQRYMDNVPDTLDLAERAKLAINALTSITDPAADSEVFWFGNFYRNPPVLMHDFNDWVQLAEGLQEALPLLRSMTGSNLNDHVDPAWMTTLLKSIGPDGLVYIPLEGRPWGRLNSSEVDPVWKPDGSTARFSDDRSITQFTTGEVCARTIGTMTLYYQRDKNLLWREGAQKMVDRLSALTVDKGEYAYLMGSYVPNARVAPDARMPFDFMAEEWDGRMIQGLAQFYRATGYGPAAELAGKFNRFYRFHSRYYDERGRFLPEPQFAGIFAKFGGKGMTLGGHAHAHTIGLMGMLEYAVAVNDRDTLEFVRSSFDWAKAQNEAFGASSLVGWFPEFYAPTYPYCESCTNGDMFGLAVKLTEAGAGDYWDDMDRWMRNHFSEAQLTSVDWVYPMSKALPPSPVKSNETAERVPERNLGAWSGWADPNGWSLRPGSEYPGIVGFQHCCTGNAPRGLYYVWNHMIRRKGEQLQVNLLLNRASRDADVYSSIPYEGRVEIKLKQNFRQLGVRAPEWVARQSPLLTCKVNETSRSLHWDGRYVQAGAVKPGDRAVFTFPITERTVKERIGPATYSLLVKGNTVLSIDPPGKHGPFYEGRGKGNRTPWRQMERFAPNEEIAW
jgi:hypothetical protein